MGGQRTKDRGQRTKNKAQSTKHKEQRTKNKEQRTKNKEQRTKNKEQRTKKEERRKMNFCAFCAYYNWRSSSVLWYDRYDLRHLQDPHVSVSSHPRWSPGCELCRYDLSRLHDRS